MQELKEKKIAASESTDDLSKYFCVMNADEPPYILLQLCVASFSKVLYLFIKAGVFHNIHIYLQILFRSKRLDSFMQLAKNICRVSRDEIRIFHS